MMRNKIVITALTMMLAASAATPVYAALPEGVAQVSDQSQIKGELEKWADAQVDALNAIPDAKEQYRELARRVLTAYGRPAPGRYNSQEAVVNYNQGLLGDEELVYLFTYLGTKVGLDVQEYGIYKMGAPGITASVVIDDVRYFTGLGECKAYGFEDAYVFALPNTIGITLGDESQPAVGGLDRTWTDSWDAITGEHHVYDVDGTRDSTLYNLRETHKPYEYFSAGQIFYKCVGGQLYPITAEEAASLGYVAKY